MINVNKLKGKIVAQGLTVRQVASAISMNPSTLYRKMQDSSGKSFSIRDVQRLAQALKLSTEDIDDIFFSQGVA